MQEEQGLADAAEILRLFRDGWGLCLRGWWRVEV